MRKRFFGSRQKSPAASSQGLKAESQKQAQAVSIQEPKPAGSTRPVSNSNLLPKSQLESTDSTTRTEKKNPQAPEASGSPNALPQNLWTLAYDELSRNNRKLVEDYQKILKEHSDLASDSVKPANEQLALLIVRKGKEIDERKWTVGNVELREHVRRIAGLLKGFQKVGTFVAEVDPVHVAIPWAGVSLCLSLLLNDITENDAAVAGLVEVEEYIRYYQAAEVVYLTNIEGVLLTNYRTELINLYSSILAYQAKVACYFSLNTALRMARNIAKIDDWESQLDDKSVIHSHIQNKGNQNLIASLERTMQELMKSQQVKQEPQTIIHKDGGPLPDLEGLRLPILYNCLEHQGSVFLIDLTGMQNDHALFHGIRSELAKRERFLWRSYILFPFHWATFYWICWWEFGAIEYVEFEYDEQEAVEPFNSHLQASFPGNALILSGRPVSQETRRLAFLYPQSQETANRCLHEAFSLLSNHISNPDRKKGIGIGLRILERVPAPKLFLSLFFSFSLAVLAMMIADGIGRSLGSTLIWGFATFGYSVMILGVLPMWWRFRTWSVEN